MATIYSPPSGFNPPDFDQYLKSGSGFDSAGYDKACNDFIAQLAAEAKRRPTPSTAPNDLVGEVIGFPVADGQAMYLVWKQKPLELIHLPFGDAYQITAAEARGLRIADVRAKVNFRKTWENLGDESAQWWAAQPVGSIVHYDNGFQQYVRGEVIADTDGTHKMRPVALVNLADPADPHSKGWRPMDLPRRTAWGDISYPHHAQKIINGDAWAPSPSCMYEAKAADGKLKPTDVDPTTMPPIDLTVPPPTSTEAESERLCKIRNEATALLAQRPTSTTAEEWRRIINETIAKLQEA